MGSSDYVSGFSDFDKRERTFSRFKVTGEWEQNVKETESRRSIMENDDCPNDGNRLGREWMKLEWVINDHDFTIQSGLFSSSDHNIYFVLNYPRLTVRLNKKEFI